MVCRSLFRFGERGAHAEKANHCYYRLARLMRCAPCVSIVIPLYQSADTIRETLESVVAQSLLDWECLVVDDSSSDGGPMVVRELAGCDSRIRLLRNVFSKGAAGARNTGIQSARGRYIAFLDSDDLWLPKKLERQIAFMRDVGAALTFSSYEIFGSSNAKAYRVRVAPKAVDYEALLFRNHIGCLTAVYDTKLAGKVYMPDIRMRQDWGLWLKIVRETGQPARGTQEVLARLRLRKGSLSRNKLVEIGRAHV